jgi:hypothetical protein
MTRSPPHNLRSSASAVRRKNDAKQHPLVDPFLLGSADMSTAIRRDYIIDLVSGNRHPGTVHLNFVVVADHTTLGRPTIHQIAARASVISFECRVESLMPFIVAYSVVSFLRYRVSTEKHNDRAANKGDTIPSSKVHSITSSARASSGGGTSIPSAFAVLRLMTSSYFVGACTGRSAGFSPRRMRST